MWAKFTAEEEQIINKYQLAQSDPNIQLSSYEIELLRSISAKLQSESSGSQEPIKPTDTGGTGWVDEDIDSMLDDAFPKDDVNASDLQPQALAQDSMITTDTGKSEIDAILSVEQELAAISVPNTTYSENPIAPTKAADNTRIWALSEHAIAENIATEDDTAEDIFELLNQISENTPQAEQSHNFSFVTENHTSKEDTTEENMIITAQNAHSEEFNSSHIALDTEIDKTVSEANLGVKPTQVLIPETIPQEIPSDLPQVDRYLQEIRNEYTNRSCKIFMVDRTVVDVVKIGWSYHVWLSTLESEIHQHWPVRYMSLEDFINSVRF